MFFIAKQLYLFISESVFVVVKLTVNLLISLVFYFQEIAQNNSEVVIILKVNVDDNGVSKYVSKYI